MRVGGATHNLVGNCPSNFESNLPAATKKHH